MKTSCYSRRKIPIWSALLLTVFFFTGHLEARKKKLNPNTPTTEDLANYFSENRRHITLENLKKAESLRLQTIESINQLLRTNMPDARKFELYLRLGELHSERHDYLRDVEIRTYEQKYDQWVAKGKKGREPQLSHRRSKAALLESANSFRKLVNEYPKHPRTDAALYSLAKTLLRLENDNAVLYFKQLIRTHKNSPLIPDTYLALGEYYFYKHDIDEAIENYKHAMQFRDSPVYPYAIYKLGWAYFNATPKGREQEDDFRNKTVAAFKLVIAISSKDDHRNRNLNLREEAINDLIIVFADYERTTEAMQYFAKIGEQDAFYDMLERLGKSYVENGENKKAIAVFTRLLSEAPNRERNPEIHVTLVDLWDKSGNLGKVVETLRTMDQLYTGTSSWIGANRPNKELVEAAYEKTQKEIHRYATSYHQKGYKTNRNAYLNAAADLYRTYLKSFPKSKDAYELRYYLADIYFQFKNYDQAADEYYTVSRQEPKNGKYLKDSALNAVVAIKKIDDAQKYQKLPPLGQVSRPIPLPRVKEKLVRMIDNFVELLPTEKDAFPMRFTAAQTFFDYGHYPEALKRFDLLGTMFPETKQGKSAIKMILGFYSEKKDWNNLVATCDRFLKQEKIIKAGMKKDITDMYKHGLFQLAIDFNQKRDYLSSARTFVEFQEKFPGSKEADDALYNATLNYYKVAKVEEAIAKGKLLLKSYPKSKHASDVTLDIAQTNEALADFKEAAAYYRDFGLKFRKEKKAMLALYNAAILYKGLKDYSSSEDLLNKFVSYYRKSKMAVDAYQELADINEKAKDYRNAIKYYQVYAGKVGKSSEAGLLARAKAADLMLRVNQTRNGKREMEGIRRELAKKNAPVAYEARRLVAKTMFDDLNKDFLNFREIRMTDAKRIEQQAAVKQKRLLKLVKDYERVIEVGSGEFTVASLYRVGEMHENFANELFNAPAPRGASQVEIDAYRTSIEKVAFPLKEEARKFFTAAYTRSKEVQTFTEWTKLTRQKMVEIDQEKFPAIAEKNTEPQYMSHNLIWEEAIAKIAE